MSDDGATATQLGIFTAVWGLVFSVSVNMVCERLDAVASAIRAHSNLTIKCCAESTDDAK